MKALENEPGKGWMMVNRVRGEKEKRGKIAFCETFSVYLGPGAIFSNL